MDGQFNHNRSFNNLKMATTGNSPLPPDNDRSSGELRALECNLTSLCDHIQVEGFNSGAFSNIELQAMGSTYRLHRLIHPQGQAQNLEASATTCSSPSMRFQYLCAGSSNCRTICRPEGFSNGGCSPFRRCMYTKPC